MQLLRNNTEKIPVYHLPSFPNDVLQSMGRYKDQGVDTDTVRIQISSVMSIPPAAPLTTTLTSSSSPSLTPDNSFLFMAAFKIIYPFLFIRLQSHGPVSLNVSFTVSRYLSSDFLALLQTRLIDTAL